MSSFGFLGCGGRIASSKLLAAHPLAPVFGSPTWPGFCFEGWAKLVHFPGSSAYRRGKGGVSNPREPMR